jgi:hypothetical protein
VVECFKYFEEIYEIEEKRKEESFEIEIIFDENQTPNEEEFSGIEDEIERKKRITKKEKELSRSKNEEK